MKNRAIEIALLIAGGASAQLSPDVQALLASEDPARREAAFHRLAAEDPIKPEARSELIGLLSRENAIVKAAFLEGPGASGKYGEGYGEYVGQLLDAVTKIADTQPDRADVWVALLALNAGPGDTAYGRWLGTHGDKALPYLLSYAADRRTDDWDRMNRTEALESLAQVVRYERRPDTAHHLSAKDLRSIEGLVRSGIEDADIDIRWATVTALGIIGAPEDLPTLDRVARNDTEVVANGGPEGDEVRFPLREHARDVAASVRTGLAARKPVGNQ